jgi:hypothetical protein
LPFKKIELPFALWWRAIALAMPVFLVLCFTAMTKREVIWTF